ncbi:hypothetical protein AC482_02160 [miscellaneous Crenarchaeota group-15 archaeon DG-45]|uniref:Uncharacterized protein n=1 Tax=miscellaneous Crenarchaeota group-15 archaeon DG-45 TaxID=1685127 RepID=A0A0M0BR60_9ARCH|nr:MAG: hypothetical protein AC482_02160 [miscellaneous Crenarchaeota group-15 archaeon DG-45]
MIISATAHRREEGHHIPLPEPRIRIGELAVDRHQDATHPPQGLVDAPDDAQKGLDRGGIGQPNILLGAARDLP